MSIMIGIDTGGTFTDAVAFHETRGIVASAKALTTKRDLAVGIADAVDCVMAESGAPPGDVTLVSMSTTLATNAIVEGQGGRVALVMIGFDRQALDRDGLAQAVSGDLVLFLPGGHDSHGSETAALVTDPLDAFIAEGIDGVTGFAVAARFAVRNPAHEKAVAALVRARTDLPVTCSHELSTHLGAPRRALTTVLNARLVGLIQHLVAATETLLAARGIDAPLMVVRGDGALISSYVATEKPIETILSGPAASAVGAAWLTGLTEAIVCDIGGTTTDVAVLDGGRPAIDPAGARVGGWRTMVEAVAMHTVGLGGDSEVHLDPAAIDRKLALGPRKLMPVSLLARDHPDIVHRTLDRQLDEDIPTEHAGRFALSTLRHDLSAASYGEAGATLLAALADGPVPLDLLLDHRTKSSALRRLIAAGAVAICGFCPSDAAHVLGLHDAWDGVAAAKCARLFARRRTARGRPCASDEREISQAVIDRLVRRSAETVLTVGFREDGHDPATLAQHPLVQAALDRRHGLVSLALRLDRPIVALGASAPTYYPAVARELGCEAAIPPHADVANAIGAVVGRIRVTVEALVSSPREGLFRLHLDTGQHDFANLDDAVAFAGPAMAEQATSEARRNGAEDVRIRHCRNDRIVIVEGREMFIEARLSTTASGRPRFAT